MKVFDRMEIKEEVPRFIVYFLYDEGESVHVEEVEEIDFSKIDRHIKSGGSVFIACRRAPRLLEEAEDGILRRHNEKKRARLRTRGLYRKARIDSTQKFFRR